LRELPQFQFYKSNFTSPILQVQFYKSNFTSPILQVQFYKSNFTSFARSTPEQMPALVKLRNTTYFCSNLLSAQTTTDDVIRFRLLWFLSGFAALHELRSTTVPTYVQNFATVKTERKMELWNRNVSAPPFS
jgi:hypothetical protein